jgi:transcription initiation factor TFIIB
MSEIYRSKRSRIQSSRKDGNNCEEGVCCENPCIETRNGDTVCINCGMVQGRNIVGNERRAYTMQEIENRRRTEPRWRGFGPRTILPNEKQDSKGHSLGAKKKTLYSRLSKIQQSLVSSIERNFWEAKPKMKMMASKLNLPEHIQETAWKIYTLVAKKKLTMGRTIEGFVAASLYAAIRVHDSPKLMEEVAEVSEADRHTVVRSLGMIIREVLPEIGLKYNPITAEQLIFRFGTDLGLSLEIQKQALKMLVMASKKGLRRTGKDPKGMAASALYLAAKKTDDKRTQSDIADIGGITEVTLRSRNKEIKKFFNK